MQLSRQIAPFIAAAITSPALRALRRQAAELTRRATGRPHRVLYFHEVEDPYSHLCAQVLEKLTSRFDVELVPYLVGEADAVPDRALLGIYARKDAADIAPAYGLSFPAKAEAPAPGLARDAARLLAAAPPSGFVRHAAEIGEAVWTRDAAAMEALRAELPGAADAELDSARERARKLRRKLGHYSGGMFYYAGEWYWGVDRLTYLETRLRELGLSRGGNDEAPIVAAHEPARSSVAKPGDNLVLEYFVSLRSPYSYISMERVYGLARRYGIELRLRPVLPMVMRGLEVPLAKRLYILFDTKREAESRGIPFGRISDPVGEPIRRGFSLYRFACRHGKAEAYLLSFARSVFSEGVDAGTEEGLERIVESAGLSWKEAQDARTDEEWRGELESNRDEMFAMGLWGVPSFRLLSDDRAPFVTWGQDRIWLLEQEIRNRLS